MGIHFYEQQHSLWFMFQKFSVHLDFYKLLEKIKWKRMKRDLGLGLGYLKAMDDSIESNEKCPVFSSLFPFQPNADIR